MAAEPVAAAAVDDDAAASGDWENSTELRKAVKASRCAATRESVPVSLKNQVASACFNHATSMRVF